MATFAPEATKRSLIARPKPCAPPVTTAQRPFRSILFMDALPCLEGPATIDDVSDAGRERTLVAGEIERERSDFVRRAEPPHRLPRDEHVPAAWACRGGA